MSEEVIKETVPGMEGVDAFEDEPGHEYVLDENAEGVPLEETPPQAVEPGPAVELEMRRGEPGVPEGPEKPEKPPASKGPERPEEPEAPEAPPKRADLFGAARKERDRRARPGLDMEALARGRKESRADEAKVPAVVEGTSGSEEERLLGRMGQLVTELADEEGEAPAWLAEVLSDSPDFGVDRDRDPADMPYDEAPVVHRFTSFVEQYRRPAGEEDQGFLDLVGDLGSKLLRSTVNAIEEMRGIPRESLERVEALTDSQHFLLTLFTLGTGVLGATAVVVGAPVVALGAGAAAAAAWGMSDTVNRYNGKPMDTTVLSMLGISELEKDDSIGEHVLKILGEEAALGLGLFGLSRLLKGGSRGVVKGVVPKAAARVSDDVADMGEARKRIAETAATPDEAAEMVDAAGKRIFPEAGAGDA